MARDSKLATETVNAQADALARREDSGFFRFYSGAVPASANTALASQVKLAELRFQATSAPAAVDGLLTYSPLTADNNAVGGGSATFFRTFKADGVTVVRQGTVGLAADNDADILLDDVVIQPGARVALSSLTHLVPRSA